MRLHLAERVLVTWGSWLSRLASCDRLLADGAEVLCVDNFFTGTRRTIEHLRGHPRFELLRHDITFPLYVEVDRIYNFRLPSLADSLPERSGTDHQD
jgi:UDP-glucuronate decarboxylase